MFVWEVVFERREVVSSVAGVTSFCCVPATHADLLRAECACTCLLVLEHTCCVLFSRKMIWLMAHALAYQFWSPPTRHYTILSIPSLFLHTIHTANSFRFALWW
jgi:hypothetical protein